VKQQKETSVWVSLAFLTAASKAVLLDSCAFISTLKQINMAEAPGLILGGVSLLAAFKGAVDGYLLIDSLAEVDSGQRFLCLQYIVERHKLVLWGDHFKINEESQSTLRDQSPGSRKIIALILAEIEANHARAEEFITRYEGQLESLLASSTIQDKSKPKNKFIGGIKIPTGQRKEKHHFSFVIRDKAKFEEVVQRLGKLNEDLYDVLDVRTSAFMKTTLPSYVLAGVSDQEWLESLSSSAKQMSSLVAISARLKEIQTNDHRVAGVVRYIKPVALRFEAGRERALGFCETPESHSTRVWVEWKYFPSDCPDELKEKLLKRAEHLIALLLATKDPNFRVPPTVGLFQDNAFELHGKEARLGFVYAAPPSHADPRSMRTLLEYIRETKKKTPGGPSLPSLGDRFKLAFALTSSLSLFHASKLLHRSFSSHNVLLFRPEREGSQVSIAEPFITGFGYSRLVADESLDRFNKADADRDFYVHPSSRSGFKTKHDIYSLGVVLFEIGLWSPLREKLTEALQKDYSRITAENLKDELIKSVPLLGHSMGTVYRDVVHTCLTGGYAEGVPDPDEEMLARAVFTDIITPLGNLKA
jgi:hypothetical protein